MITFFSLSSYKSEAPAIATIGTFDGVHVGHLKLLNALRQKAQQLAGETVVVTFEPHPKHVLYPHIPLKLLQTLPEKQARLALSGIDKLLVIPFTLEFSQITSEQFIKEILVDILKVKAIIVGHDHRFGKNRSGSLEDIQRGGKLYNFEVERINALEINNTIISSTQIRTALQNGEVTLANRYLGYPYSLSGAIIEGQHLGKAIGFPTANLYIENPYKLIPAVGVYAVKVYYHNIQYLGMCNIGYKPTVGTQSLSIEVHVFDFQKQIYGETLRLEFVARIRNELKFDSLLELKKQLEKDKITALQLLNPCK
ncbi:MAG: bifunctional riboflavin kinase/FAD synthetase [Bacteroidia bacterium]|nr:bifunctional riboflavin kinase/FAD synthetase [Bacteroidia bacterium]MDW8157651.1 bifunctional riboflavin kinase/FAD synthetase [Bacteroidia bacterium]